MACSGRIGGRRVGRISRTVLAAAGLTVGLVPLVPRPAEAVPVGGEFRVNTIIADYQQGPVVAMDDEGDFVVVWQSGGSGGANTDIHGQRYSAAGVPQGGEFQINTYTNDGQLTPSVAMDADGDFVVAWQSSGQDGSYSGIYAQRFSAAGAPLGGEFRVNTTNNRPTELRSRPSCHSRGMSERSSKLR